MPMTQYLSEGKSWPVQKDYPHKNTFIPCLDLKSKGQLIFATNGSLFIL